MVLLHNKKLLYNYTLITLYVYREQIYRYGSIAQQKTTTIRYIAQQKN